MADRAPARIRIGGTVSPQIFAQLCEFVAREDLRIDWDDEPFDPCKLTEGAPLDLYATEVAGAMFDDLEQFCLDNAIAYWRWGGGCSGAFAPEIVVHDGRGEPLAYYADEDGNVVLSLAEVRAVKSIRELRRYIKWSEAKLPAFSVPSGEKPLRLQSDTGFSHRLAG